MPHGSWLMCNRGLWCADTFQLNRRRWEALKCHESWSSELSGGSDVTSHPIPTKHSQSLTQSYPTHLFLKFPCGFCTQTRHRQHSVNWKQVTWQFITGCILFNLKIFSLDSPPLFPPCIHVLWLCQLHLTSVFFFSLFLLLWAHPAWVKCISSFTRMFLLPPTYWNVYRNWK